MGLIYTQLKLGNPSAEDLLPIDVDALADSSAGFLCIPPHVALQLRLKELHKREVTFANSAKQLCPYEVPIEHL